MASKNQCAKTVEPQEAYEVWQVKDHPEYGGEWTWFVLKKYQSPEREGANLYARWFCYVTSPYSDLLIKVREKWDSGIFSIADKRQLLAEFLE